MRMPHHVAMELPPTGRWMGAEEAHRWGLVNEVLADEDALMERVWEVARLLESGPPLVFAAIKEVARAAEGAPFQDVLDQVTGRDPPDRRHSLRLRGRTRGLQGVRGETTTRVEGTLKAGETIWSSTAWNAGRVSRAWFPPAEDSGMSGRLASLGGSGGCRHVAQPEQHVAVRQSEGVFDCPCAARVRQIEVGPLVVRDHEEFALHSQQRTMGRVNETTRPSAPGSRSRSPSAPRQPLRAPNRCRSHSHEQSIR